MTDRDDIDRLLRESGERWRSTHLPLPTVNEAMFREHRAAGSASTMRWLPAVAGLAILALVAAVALRTALADPTGPGVGLPPTPATSTSSPPPETSLPPAAAPTTASPLPESTATPGATPSASQLKSNDPLTDFPAIVRDGDPVVAYGNMFETEAESEALLCRWAGGWPPDVGCVGMGTEAVVVTIRGVDVRDFPGDEADPNVPDLPRGTWVSNYVRVDGVWANGALEATHIELAQQPSIRELSRLTEVPCEPPAGGWPGYPQDPEVVGRAEDALEAEVSGNPDEYAGISSAVAMDADGRIADSVVVVGTVVDIDSVAPKLHSIFPFNLCIVRAEYSARELQDVVDALADMKRGWEIWIDTSIARVAVYVPVFDQATEDAIRQYSSIVSVRPILVRSGD